eukprot:1550178-Rhodomonas_salina.1
MRTATAFSTGHGIAGSYQLKPLGPEDHAQTLVEPSPRHFLVPPCPVLLQYRPSHSRRVGPYAASVPQRAWDNTLRQTLRRASTGHPVGKSRTSHRSVQDNA